MASLPPNLQRAINEFAKLPGLGPKSAQRLVFYMLRRSQTELDLFLAGVAKLKDGVIFCSVCKMMTETSVCATCQDKTRDSRILCVVEDSLDAVAIDNARAFNGLFHVLGGVLNPMDGVGPDKLKIAELLQRLSEAEVREVILATNPTLEGEATAMYIARVVKNDFPSVRLTRIARGLPTGGELEYADELTLSRALEGRREF